MRVSGTLGRKLGTAVFLAVLAGTIIVGPATVGAQELSYDEVYTLAAEAIGPGPGAHFAVRVARCESGLNASAYSAGWDRFWRVNYSHVGLWQVESGIWGTTAWREFGGSLWEPRVNAQMMGLILREQGWARGWPWCSAHAWR